MAKSRTRPSPEDLKAAGQALIDWYGSRSRDLPWRRDISIYRVLVSEVMLQQTRAETVAPRFEQFMEQFPDAAALAAAPEDEVLKAWEGLGYYARARNLHRAASLITKLGEPTTCEELSRLPGVGPYTAAAVLAIACRQPVVAVDANAVRIALRLLALPEEPARSRGAAETCLRQMLPEEEPDVFAQAVMELGQTVCRPRQALCEECPLSTWCAGREDPLSYPARAEKKKRPRVPVTVAVLKAAGKVALRRRPADGLLAGLWEPLNWSGTLSEGELRGRLLELGVCAGGAVPLRSWRHEFTHRIWELSGWQFTVGKEQPMEDVVWADHQALEQVYAVPTVFQPAFTEWRARHGKTCGRKTVPLGISD